MNLQDKIKSYSTEWLNKTLDQKGDAGLLQFVEFLFDKTFAIADTGIDRRDIHLWNKDNLLPFNQEQGWDKFSFVDVLWLNMLSEFKNLGLSRKTIEVIKDHLFTISENAWPLVEEKINTCRNNRSVFSKNIDKESQRELLSKGFGMLAIYTIISIIYRRRFLFVGNAKEEIELVDIDLVSENPFENLPAFFEILSMPTSRIVNLSSIIERISEASGLFTMKENELIVRESAVAIIKRLFRDNNIKEILIRLTNKDDLILTLTEQLSYKQLNQKINSLQRKGQFMDIQIKTRDGKIQHFESSRLIKL